MSVWLARDGDRERTHIIPHRRSRLPSLCSRTAVAEKSENIRYAPTRINSQVVQPLRAYTANTHRTSTRVQRNIPAERMYEIAIHSATHTATFLTVA